METDIGVMLPKPKEHLAPPKASRDKEEFSFRDFGGSVVLLTLLFWTSGLQDCERIGF